MQAFSIFNVDIDVTAPECLIPEFTYEVKWWVSIMLPAASGVMLVLLFLLSKAINLCMIERRKTKFTLSALISMSLLIIYYVYLMVTKRALELLNCKSLSLGVVLCLIFVRFVLQCSKPSCTDFSFPCTCFFDVSLHIPCR